MSDKHKFYGNYRAKVLFTDAAEQTKLGRIKVEVYPMLIGTVTAQRLSKDDKIDVTGIATTDLPWCMPAYPLAIGSGDSIGAFAVPDIGTYVWVFFEAGDIYSPVYFAEAPTATLGLPTSREANYPQRRILKFKYVEIIIDDTAKEIIINADTDMHVVVGRHCTINAGDDVIIDAEGDVIVNAAGKVDIDAGGDCDIDAGGDVNINASNINLN